MISSASSPVPGLRSGQVAPTSLLKHCWMLFVLFGIRSLAQLPDTDIWLLDAKWFKDSLVLQNPLNITNRAGYDNQPAFSPDGRYILFTSIREKRSDIYKYDIISKTVSQFTNTPGTAEYSPTFMGKGKGISVVMVEADDSTQRIWKFPMGGGSKAKPVLPLFDSIGYHCWYDHGNRIAAFFLTEPSSLQMIGRHYDRPKFIDDSVGRCMQMQGSLLFYTRKKANGLNELKWFNLPGWHTESSGAVFESEDYVLANYKLIYGKGGKIFICDAYGEGKKREVCDLGDLRLTNITRIAVSKDGSKLAIVAETTESRH